MQTDAILGLLGLSLRAGKIGIGDALTQELTMQGKGRCVIVASDAGTGSEKRAAQYASRAGIPLLPLPYGKAQIGGALGRGECAVCVLTDIGMAAALAEKLKDTDPALAQAAQALREKERRIRARRGIKKKKAPANGMSNSAEKPVHQTKSEVSANGN